MSVPPQQPPQPPLPPQPPQQPGQQQPGQPQSGLQQPGQQQPGQHWPAPSHWPPPQPQQPHQSNQPPQYPSQPPRQPGQPGQPGQPQKRRGPWPVVLGILAVLVVGGGLGWGALSYFGGRDDGTVAAPSTSPTSAPAQSGTPGAPGEEPSGNPSEELVTPDDPAAALKQQVEKDAPEVRTDVEGKWVAQLSSKKPGLKADGRTWDEQAILDEHNALRKEHPRVRLLWSGDYASFKNKDFYVSIVGIGFDDPDAALSWCGSHGFGTDSCYAKKISRTGGHEDTTRLG